MPQSRGLDLTNGQSTVTARFLPKTVDVTLSDFTVTDQASGAATTAPFPRARVTGMTLSGTSFSGGTMTFLNGSNPADVSLAGFVSATNGQLFGPAAEAGGILRYTADQTIFGATFLAAE